MRVGCPQSPNVGPVSTCLSHLPTTDAGRLTSANLIGHQFFQARLISAWRAKTHFSSHLYSIPRPRCLLLRFQTDQQYELMPS